MVARADQLAQPGAVRDDGARRRADRRRPGRGRRSPRVLQRLPPPRGRRRDRARRARRHLLRCPYHGWTYSLDGRAQGHAGLRRRLQLRQGDQTASMPVAVGEWEKFVFVELEPGGPSLTRVPGRPRRRSSPSSASTAPLRRAAASGPSTATGRSSSTTTSTAGTTSRTCTRASSSVLDYSQYTIENGDRYCLQWSPDRRTRTPRATWRGAHGRPGALLLALSELHDQLVRGRHGHEPRPAARSAARG